MTNNEIVKRIAQVEKLNQTFPKWGKNEVEQAKQALDHLSDFDNNKSAFRTLFANIKQHGNAKLLKKAQKFATKKGMKIE